MQLRFDILFGKISPPWVSMRSALIRKAHLPRFLKEIAASRELTWKHTSLKLGERI